MPTLFPPDPAGEAAPADLADAYTTGILPSQGLRAAIDGREIAALEPIGEDQVQPASLDLRLGPVAWRVRASFLPGRNATVRDRVDALAMHRLDLDQGAVLERDCVYIVPLQEQLALRKRTSGLANPKSSTGRLDVFARLITDHGTEFDRVRERYQGPLYAEISPRAFPILVRTGSRLVQLRLKRGSPPASDALHRRLHGRAALVEGDESAPDIKGGIAFSVDVEGRGPDDLIGFRARRHAGLIDVDLRGHYDPADFWEPVRSHPGQGLILDPSDFYILASREAVAIPVNYAAEMLAYDTLVGEFRVHYAGFFDPGFGDPDHGGAGTRAVLEVRSHEVPFIVQHGQVVGRLVYERLTRRPDKLYGAGIGSHYQRQGLALAKQFRPFPSG